MGVRLSCVRFLFVVFIKGTGTLFKRLLCRAGAASCLRPCGRITGNKPLIRGLFSPCFVGQLAKTYTRYRVLFLSPSLASNVWVCFLIVLWGNLCNE